MNKTESGLLATTLQYTQKIMGQRRIDDYFTPSQPRHARPRSGRTFLDLPAEIRRRIYLLAGLVRVCLINLNFERADWDEMDRWTCLPVRPPARTVNGECSYRQKRFEGVRLIQWKFEESYCSCELIPSSLLYISRTVYAEVRSILYGENKFKISRSRPGGLEALYHLSDDAFAELTSLSIRLNTCSCIVGHRCTRPERACDCHPICEPGQDEPLGNISRYDKSVLREWYQVCQRIAALMSTSRLTLSVMCDTTDLETAEEVVRPLRCLPAPLKDCAIRLGQKPDYQRRRLAEITVMQAMARWSIEDLTAPFRFTQLPREIQRQILEETDLVAPYDLEWDLDFGLLSADCCRHCTDSLEICCCSSQHAAFSTTCICWKMPTAIFQMSHQVRTYAIQIFYSRNHFTVTRGTLWDFLTRLPHDAWPCLRSLTWMVPAFRSDYILANKDEERSRWGRTIDLMVRYPRLAELSLTIDMTSELKMGGDPYMDLVKYPDEEQAMWEAYQRFLEPLSQLGLLKDLFVHLSWPMDDDEDRHRREQILEKRVMGDMYDSVARGKYEPRRTRWNFNTVKESFAL